MRKSSEPEPAGWRHQLWEFENAFLDLVEQWPAPPEPLRKIYNEDGNGGYESEADFNARFANTSGLVVLDSALIQVPGADRSEFEPCDVLDIATKGFLHIKIELAALKRPEPLLQAGCEFRTSFQHVRERLEQASRAR